MSCSQHTTTTVLTAENAAVIAHVNLLQGIINRLANNSASCKTWCLALVSALVGLAGATHIAGIISFALVPVVIFAFVDSMYLAQERAYRALYRQVVAQIRKGAYTCGDVFEAAAPVNMGRVFSAFTSWSIYPIYLGLVAMYLVAYFTGWLRLLTSTIIPK